MNNAKSVLRTVIILSLLGVGALAFYSSGAFELMLITDSTGISVSILVILLLASLYLSFHTVSGIKLPEHTLVEWTAEHVLVLGMIGTVIGFLSVLSVCFADLDVSDVNSMREALSTFVSGAGTALWTTLMGLICHLLLKLQLWVNQDLPGPFAPFKLQSSRRRCEGDVK
jgi:hypothetical protein